MKSRRVVIAALGAVFLAGAASAETIVIRPDACALPADAPKIISLSGVEAVDLNPDRASAEHILVLYPLPERGWASARILARFAIEGREAPPRRRFCP